MQQKRLVGKRGCAHLNSLQVNVFVVQLVHVQVAAIAFFVRKVDKIGFHSGIESRSLIGQSQTRT